MAPEIVEKKGYNGISVDIFSLGVILFTMVIGHPPFNKASINDPFYRYIYGNKYEDFWYIH